jgi:iron(III) transport system ATP-binding protein
MAAIGIEQLVVGYTDKPVIDGFSLQIHDGELFTLLGPSGCGKTTLLRTLAGFIPVRSGRVRFGDRDVTTLAAYQRDVGMVFQDYALFPDKSVFDNVAYGLRARRQDSTTVRQTVGEYLERVGLSALAERMPAALSGGQRQRVALARALAIRPTVLLMDEPLSNLDAKLRVQVRDTIADLQREVGITTVLVTHDQEEALSMSDRIGLLRDGRLEQAGTPQALYEEPVSAYVADFVGAANLLKVSLAKSLSAVNMSEHQQSVAAGETAEFELAGAALRVRVAAAITRGEAVLMVRAEHLRLLPPERVAGLAHGTVRRLQYLGARTLYRVELTDGQWLAVEAPGSAERWAVGAACGIDVDTARARLLPA